MSKTIEDLREHLFAAIAGVKAGTTTVEQAKTISELSHVIVNTAKVEIDYLRVTDCGESSFISTAVGRNNLPVGLRGVTREALPNGIVGITRHTLKDD
jgi:hypothetical protein